MSSIIAIQQTDAIHLITDGARYDHDGVILSLGSKVVHLRASNCVFTLRGANWPVLPLELALRWSTTLDQVAEALPQTMRFMLNSYDKAVAQDMAVERHPVDRHFELTLAGWSDRMQRMVALVASTYAVRDPVDLTGMSHQAGYVPCTPWLPAQGYSQPPLQWETVLGRPFTEQSHVDALDPVVDGLTLHEAQRNEGGVYCGRAAYLVGGFAELTTVRREGVERQVIHRWPDAIGARITPAGAPPLDTLQAVMDTELAYRDVLQAYHDARASARPRLIEPCSEAA